MKLQQGESLISENGMLREMLKGKGEGIGIDII